MPSEETADGRAREDQRVHEVLFFGGVDALTAARDSTKVASQTPPGGLAVRMMIGYSLPLWATDEYLRSRWPENGEDGIVPMGKEASSSAKHGRRFTRSPLQAVRRISSGCRSGAESDPLAVHRS